MFVGSGEEPRKQQSSEACEGEDVGWEGLCHPDRAKGGTAKASQPPERSPGPCHLRCHQGPSTLREANLTRWCVPELGADGLLMKFRKSSTHRDVPSRSV